MKELKTPKMEKHSSNVVVIVDNIKMFVLKVYETVTQKVVDVYCLKNQEKHSTKHGVRRSRLYSIWSMMKQRCFNPNATKYRLYGGRGITICPEWKNDFKSFYDWAMSNGYQDNLTIDRIDSDGNYEPTNCQWITLSENGKKGNIKRNSNKGEIKNVAT